MLVVTFVLDLLSLSGFAPFADLPVPAVIRGLGIGLLGVTINAATATRVHRTGNASPPANTVHSSFSTLGVISGLLARRCRDRPWGLRAPLRLGTVMTLKGPATVLPGLGRRCAVAATAKSPAPAPVGSASGKQTQRM
ncbi:hypothetical protein [Streptomyces cellulosae]|uniref:Major facilitator superfamily (MFS) profile domain-containing protein n=1 Tax=Streptomyces cellulosae TaxID=1968 RepID=A0ABW7XV67_STRCE